MHFIRHCIINADAYDIKIERCRWKSRRVTYRCSVPFPPPPPPSLLLSFSRGASKQEREANTPILINSRGISIYSSQKKHERGREMRPLPLSTCVIFQPANPLSTPVFRSRCNFSSRNTPVIESSLVQLLGILPLRRLAPFLPPLFSRRFSTIRLNRSPFRFSLASTKSVCLDATSEKLEDRNCSDVTEFFFFFQNRWYSRIVNFF